MVARHKRVDQEFAKALDNARASSVETARRRKQHEEDQFWANLASTLAPAAGGIAGAVIGGVATGGNPAGIATGATVGAGGGTAFGAAVNSAGNLKEEEIKRREAEQAAMAAALARLVG